MTLATVERRVVAYTAAPVKVENRMADDGSIGPPMITGYGSVFHRGDDPGTMYQLMPGLFERVMPGCFDRCIREGQDVRGLFNHDPNMLLARCSAGTMRLSVDATGLRYEMDCNPNDPDHQRVMQKIQRGDITGSSFSFRVRQQRFTLTDDECDCDPDDPDCDCPDDYRDLLDVDVDDCGPVTFPAYTATAAGMAYARAAGDATLEALRATWKAERAARRKARVVVPDNRLLRQRLAEADR
jgi:HK97 family phage prohead protease